MSPKFPPIQIAPNSFIPEDTYEAFLDELEFDGDTLASYLDLVRAAGVELTHDNVDEYLWLVFEPIFAYINFQLALAAGDKYAVAIHKAVQLAAVEQSARRAAVRHSVDQMFLAFGSR